MKKISLLLVFVMATMLCMAANPVIYVAQGGSGEGTSWSDPMGDIQQAVDSAYARSISSAEYYEVWIKAGTYPLSEMIRLRQATGYTGILSSSIQESAKLDRMEELIDEALENNKKVVVFSNWTQITDVVYDKLVKKYRVGRIIGQTNDDDRVKIVNAYQNGMIDIMIGTIGAMGTGLTLTAGSVEIFLDHPWNRALYDQAVDRCHRIGQKSNITIYNLLTKNTIDERIWELVCKKGKLADAIVDGQLNNMDKGDLVDYLLS